MENKSEQTPEVIHEIAFNNFNAQAKGAVRTCSLDAYDKALQNPGIKEILKKLADHSLPDKEAKILKNQLYYRCPHYFRFKDDRRRKDAIMPEEFTYQTCVDVDDPEFVDSAIEKAKALDTALGKWHEKLLHMEYSARHKLHIDIRLPLGMTIEEAQKDYSEQIGVPYDSSCITPERMIYMTSDEYEIFRSPHWYERMDQDHLQMYRDAMTDRGLRIDGQPLDASSGGVSSGVASNGGKALAKDLGPLFTPGTATYGASSTSDEEIKKLARQVFDIDEMVLRKDLHIFDRCRELAHLNENDLTVVGNRHNNLIAILSKGMNHLMTKEECLATVRVKMPEYAQEADCIRLISDSYLNYAVNGRMLTNTELEMNAWAQHEAQKELSSEGSETPQEPPEQTFEKPVSLTEKFGQLLDVKHLPIGLADTVVNTKPNMYLPKLAAVLPIAAAYADECSFEYADGGRPHQLGLMAMIIGPQASGKSQCAQVAEIWLKPIKEEDAIQRKREDEVKERRKNRKANEKAPEDPHVVIRFVPMTISNSVLLKRLKNSQGHTLVSFDEELDTVITSNGAGAWSQKTDKYRKGFDGSEWGQDYNSDQAESGLVSVRYNWSVLGTYGSFKKFFNAKTLENGLSSRMLIAEMPDNSFHKMEYHKDISVTQKEHIDEAVTILRNYKEFYEPKALNKAIRNWVDGKAEEADRSDDRQMDIYRKRAAVIGWRCGLIYYILSRTKKESKHCIAFALLMAEYTLQEQLKCFGKDLEEATVSAEMTGTYRTENKCIFDLLPEVFDLTKLMSLKSGCTDRAAVNMIYRWKKSGWIVKQGSVWKKISKSQNLKISN